MDTNTLPIPSFLNDRYQVTRVLGRGGMGVVYHAHDTKMEREVALKHLTADDVSFCMDQDQSRNWEAIIGGRLQHPHIVMTYDIFSYQGSSVIVTEYFDGCDLKDFLHKNPLYHVSQIIPILSQVCEALHYAHSQGVVHQDMKPENILVNEHQKVKIVDFGIAKFVSETRRSRYELEYITGTPSYMSPETIRQQEIDGRSDIFSLGIILYELLTGKRPFDGEPTSKSLYLILSADPPPPSKLTPGLPIAYDHIVARALKKNRNLRYQTMKALQEDLLNVDSLQYFLHQKEKLETIRYQEAITERPFPPPEAQNIVCVDDDINILEILSAVLKAKGYHPTVFEHPKEALQHLNNAIPSVIISDIMMDDMDGYQFCLAVRKQVHLSKVPFIFLTAKQKPSERLRGFEVGADDYVMKPFHPKEILFRINTVLQEAQKIQIGDSTELDYQFAFSSVSKNRTEPYLTTKKATPPDWNEGELQHLFAMIETSKDSVETHRMFWTIKAKLIQQTKENLTLLKDFIEPLMNRVRFYMLNLQFSEVYCLLDMVV